MEIGWKIASGLASAAAGLVASKVADVGWKGITGHPGPTDDADDAPIKEILAFAVVSATVAALFQVFATRTAKRWYDGSSKNSGLA